MASDRRPSRRSPRSSAPKDSTLRLRRARPDDLSLLVQHRHRMWREIGRWSEADLDRADVAYRRWVRRQRAEHRFFAFIVEDGQRSPVGSGAVWLAPNQPRPGHLASPVLPYIMSMFTEPHYRGRGVASRLVRAMVVWSARRGFPRVVLHASKKGRPVYARLGFENGSEMRLALPRARRR